MRSVRHLLKILLGKLNELAELYIVVNILEQISLYAHLIVYSQMVFVQHLYPQLAENQMIGGNLCISHSNAKQLI